MLDKSSNSKFICNYMETWIDIREHTIILASSVYDRLISSMIINRSFLWIDGMFAYGEVKISNEIYVSTQTQ